MTKQNYSKDAVLQDIEVIDFDTKNLNPTGINDGRMRLPDRYDISKYYKRITRNSGKHRAGEYGNWKNKQQEDLPDITQDFNWQITYSFPSSLHSPVTRTGAFYGGRNVTYRRLYLILCEHFNEGRYFVDDYFDTVYPHTIKPEVDKALDKIKVELLGVINSELEAYTNPDGSMRRGYRKTIKDYEKFAQAWEDSESQAIADMIKEDIILSVRSGQIPLAYDNSIETKKRRIKAGLNPVPKFSATADLIEHIQLFVKIGGNKKWETKSGILV